MLVPGYIEDKEELRKQIRKLEKTNLEDNETIKTATVSEVTDKVCDDNFYNNGYETYENDDEFINEISVEAEGEDNLNEESFKNILEKAGIGILDVTINSDPKETTKACVRIKKDKRKILEEAVFPLSVSGLKMEIFSPD